MKARVLRHLNIRTGLPRILPDNNPGYFDPGDVIDIADVVVGDSYKGNNVWYKLNDGGFVWAGGAERLDNELHTLLNDPPAGGFDLTSLVRLNGGLSVSSKGAGGVVAVLDSGVSNTSLTNRIVLERNFVEADPDARDLFGHGTKMAGIICGNGPVINSLSSQCSIVNFRVADKNGTILSTPVFNAMKALDEGNARIDVVNMSFDISPSLLPVIQPIVDSLLQKGSVCVVAAGNGNRIKSIAALKNVVRVGAFKKEDFQTLKQSGLNAVYHCAFVDTPIISTSRSDGSEEAIHVSAYTALASSFICSFLLDPGNSGLNGMQRLQEAINFITRASFPFMQQQSPDDFKPLKP